MKINFITFLGLAGHGGNQIILLKTEGIINISRDGFHPLPSLCRPTLPDASQIPRPTHY